MINEENADKIRNLIAACDAHNIRMKSALKKLSSHFPLSKAIFIELSEDQISYTDQLILRFLKLQDLLGQKLFPHILLALEEDYSNQPFIDILNRLEQLKIIDSSEKWIAMREVRNLITHDYPHLIGELVEGLNQLSVKALELSEQYDKIRGFVTGRFDIL
ncbi:MAG: hypothetical protein PHY99_07850 [Bacteroidales bacterium]|nr:hypothetical protein [Bacteroidales bacterium]